jgi:hypothetical protein
VQTKSTALGSPYGDCVETAPVGASYYDGEYTLEGCYRSCLQDMVFQKCNCYDDTLAYPEKEEAKRCSALSVPGQSAASEYLRAHTHIRSQSIAY